MEILKILNNRVDSIDKPQFCGKVTSKAYYLTTQGPARFYIL